MDLNQSAAESSAVESMSPRDFCVELTGGELHVRYGTFDHETAVKEMAKMVKARPQLKVTLARWDDQPVEQPALPVAATKKKATKKATRRTRAAKPAAAA